MFLGPAVRWIPEIAGWILNGTDEYNKKSLVKGGILMKKIFHMVLSIFFFFLAGNLIPVRNAVCAEGMGKAVEGDPVTEAAQAGTEKTGHKKIIVARVNGAGITMQSLMTMANRMIEKKGRGDAGVEDFQKIREDALNRLILQELALQDARKRGMAVDQKKIDETIANLKISMGGEEEYGKYLAREGMTGEEARAEVERTLALQMIFDKEVKELNEKIVLDEDTLRKEYEKNEARFVQPEKISVIDVVLFLTSEDKDAKKITGEVLRKIKEDKDRNPLNLVPDGTFIVRELDLNKTKYEILYEEAGKLKEGELSGIIETPDSLHIIKLTKFSPEKKYSFDEVRVFLERKFRSEALLKRLQEWEAELRKDAKIEIMDFDKINR
jgi:parvulin-like peptidyl-prolyl isomerase